MAANTIIVKPFEKDPSGQYIDKLSNHLFDYIMPSLTPAAWIVLCLIIRKTVGWQKESDEISLGEIKKGTGIKTDATTVKALGELEEKKYILVTHRAKTRQANIYKLNTTLKIEVVTTAKNRVVSETTTENEVVTTAKNEVVEALTTSKIEDTKEQYLNTNEKEQAHKQDYLGTIVNGQGKATETTGDNPEDQYFEYRDEFLATYRDMTGEYPEPLVKDEISKLITIGITPTVWLESWRQCKLNWSGKNKIPLARVIEVCKFGGDYEKWRKFKYPEEGNGRDSPPKPKLKLVPVTQESENNGND